MHEIPSDVNRLIDFESLGSNCEFGFVQRHAGVEPGGLLRWAISPPQALAECIRNSFESIYKFENLFPSAPRMVKDNGSGLAFHTRMYSTDGNFDISDLEERKKIWIEESGKVFYLRDKLNSLLSSGEKTFVYKRNEGISRADLGNIGAAISERGPGRLLYVELDPDRKPGSVYRYGDNILIGVIDAFAPYSAANNASYDVWNEILSNAADL
ncbi:hypothetical protein [Paracoccus sp. R86501]|uniref:hypothetical protein n=1 Tax=Paracoccus sp. R86501 TaxID=3101711 RepID=UPI003672A0E2